MKKLPIMEPYYNYCEKEYVPSLQQIGDLYIIDSNFYCLACNKIMGSLYSLEEHTATNKHQKKISLIKLNTAPLIKHKLTCMACLIAVPNKEALTLHNFFEHGFLDTKKN